MDTIYKLIIVLVPMILSLSVHEFAHAFSAYRLGDDTAARRGRLTLNPAAHIDPIGTLLLPILLTIGGGGFFFGWAKPVPITPSRFRRDITMRSGQIITAMAGPASNLIIAFLASGAVIAMAKFHLGGESIQIFLVHLLQINLALALFNVIPVPPLDGHYLLPETIKNKLQQHQMIVFVGLIVAINMADNVLARPLMFLLGLLQTFWTAVFGGF